MKKNSILFSLLFIATVLKAQHVELKQVIRVPYQPVSGYSAPNGSCDTLNIYAAQSLPTYYYEYRGGGSVIGTNNLTATKNETILEDANAFNVSGSAYNFITGGLVDFAFSNSNTAANLDKDLIFKIYDDAGGEPGTLLGSATLKLAQVHADVVAGKLTEFKLTTPVAVPASKKFYVSVDHSNFTWLFPKQDSIAIVASGNHSTPNTAYQFLQTSSGTQWSTVPKFWRNVDGSDSLDVSLFIFPYLRNSLTDCVVLPVSMYNFGGFIKDYKAYLNWSTASESNNKGFYVERSKDGRNFTSIGFIAGAGNSSQIKNYTYTDVSLKDINVSTTYYRLKQVDLDGKTSYSNVLSLDLKNIFQWKFYPNPVKNVATIELNLTTSSKVNLQVFSREGKILMNADKGFLNQGTQQLFLNVQNLAKGSYTVRIKTNSDTYTMTFVKE